MNTDITKLLVTDFDGTLVGNALDHQELEVFAQLIRCYQGNGGIWVVATGRSIQGFRKYFSPLQRIGVMPEYLICRNAYIYKFSGGHYHSRWGWNLKIRALIKKERKRRAAFIERLRMGLPQLFDTIKLTSCSSDELIIGFASHKDAMQAGDMVRGIVGDAQSLMVFEYYQAVEVRTVPFTKGMSVSRLARHLNIEKSHVLAIGDGHNDISMLSEAVSGMAGCPANASDEVVDYIHLRGGHISSCHVLAGVMDTIHAYGENGVVNSERPEGAVLSQARMRKNQPAKGSTGHSRTFRRWRKMRRAGILCVVFYIVLLVAATYGLIPYANVITAPLTFIVDMLSILMV